MPVKQKNKKIKKQKKPDSPHLVHGTADVLPKEGAIWQTLFRAGFSVAEYHNFHFIETPVLEPAELFASDDEDAEKRFCAAHMGKGVRALLAPGGPLPVLRSYIENHLGYFASPLKVFRFGPVFRRGDDGKMKGSHEWRFDILGDNDPVYDIQTAAAALDFLKALKLRNMTLAVNTNGCRTCHHAYREKLKAYYAREKHRLCALCAKRSEEDVTSPFRCPNESCRQVREGAPIILDFLCQSCNNHFKALLELIEDNGILYEPDPYLIRDESGFNRMIFSIRMEGAGELAGGGRYDYLAESIGGRQIPGVGVSLFLERIVSAIEARNAPKGKEKPKVFFVAVGDQAKKSSVRLIGLLRSSGVVVMETLGKKSLKAQLKTAEKFKAPLMLLLGQKEVFEETLIVRDMETGAQETVTLSQMVDVVKKKLKD